MQSHTALYWYFLSHAVNILTKSKILSVWVYNITVRNYILLDYQFFLFYIKCNSFFYKNPAAFTEKTGMWLPE